MILFFGMQLVPLGYGIAYLVHSAAKRRKGQAAAIAEKTAAGFPAAAERVRVSVRFRGSAQRRP